MEISRRMFIGAGGAGLLAAAAPTIGVPAERKRLARKDCFFGIHFDLHPNKNDTILGRDISEEMIDRFLTRVKPDFVQYDCKGHPGYTGYPTRVGTPSPGIVRDSLEFWRRVTARHGVALFIHYSGVWDEVACEKHPEWALVRADGTHDKQKTSTFGPYVDQLLIPQLKEVGERYDLDGAWVDGECWALLPDYCSAAARNFSEQTGLGDLPRSAKDPGWKQMLELCREQFRRYVRHYIDELHAAQPGFQIASNWLYSTYVPERPELPVDFLSGDYLGNACISTARLEARYLGATGKPWDLMAWGFSWNGRESNHKPAVQLMQESSVVLAQGGGFQIYYQPSRGGHIEERFVGVMERAARFCRERQEICHKSEAVPQIGVLFSKNSLYTRTDRIFGGWGAAVNPARGMIDALVGNQFPVDVIPDWKLADVAASYPLIVVPDWPDIGSEMHDVLVSYAKQGGSLLLAGAENAALFSGNLGVELDGPPAQLSAVVAGREVLARVSGLWQKVRPVAAKAIEDRYAELDTTREAACAATLHSLGKGRIVGVYGPVGSTFATFHAPALRQFVGRIVRQVYAPMVEVEGPPTIEIVLRRKGGRHLLHLLNATAMQVAGEYAATDFIPAVGPIRVRMQLPARPRRVTLEPHGKTLAGNWQAGKWEGMISSLEIHAAISFEP